MSDSKLDLTPTPADRVCCAAILIVSICTTGCASYSFKRGASPDAMAADEQVCRAAQEDFHSCMRDRGWFIASDLGELKPTAPVSDSAVTTTESSSAATLPTSGHVVAPAPDVVATADPVAPTANRARLKRIQSVEPPQTDASDPLTLLAVGSWWKFGGNPSGLESDTTACIGKLSNAHRPEPAATVVTRGMQACLKESGWYAIEK